jgi:phosphoenolpyruvate carboxykinase (GTP)
MDFGKKVKTPPAIFSVNYFLLDKDGQFLNEKNDKKVWYKWMELRVNQDVDALKTPTGYIPKYQDLKILYSQVLNKELSESKYIELFTVRIPENLKKIERIKKIYQGILDTPPEVFSELEDQKKRLIEAQSTGDYLSPLHFA